MFQNFIITKNSGIANEIKLNLKTMEFPNTYFRTNLELFHEYLTISLSLSKTNFKLFHFVSN